MALVVDTNILLYAVNRGCPEYEFCLDFLRGLVATGDTCFVPENVSAHTERDASPTDPQKSEVTAAPLSVNPD
jgi:predicted nucleic acid-binding protein